MEKAHQTCRPKIPKNPDEQSAGFMHRPKIPKNQARFLKILGFLGILGLCMNPALCSSGFLGILGLCTFCDFKEGESSPNLHRAKIPKNPDEQSAGFMHRPKIRKNPKIFCYFVRVLPDSSSKSWDS